MSESRPASGKPVRIPGPDHPITIEPNPGRVIVSIAGQQVADTREALTLKEAEYDPVQYIQLDDVDLEALTPSDHESSARRTNRRASGYAMRSKNAGPNRSELSLVFPSIVAARRPR